MEYKVVEDSNLADLVTMVNRYLANGWVCQGGIAPVSNGASGSTKYLQAMVKTNSASENDGLDTDNHCNFDWTR